MFLGLYRECKSVVSGVHGNVGKLRELLFVDGEPLVYLFVRAVVADVREPDMFWVDLRSAFKCF